MTSVENPMGLQEVYVGYGYCTKDGLVTSLFTKKEGMSKEELSVHGTALHLLLKTLQMQEGTLREKVKDATDASVYLSDVIRFNGGGFALEFHWTHSPRYWTGGGESGTEYEYGFGPVSITEEEKDIVLALYVAKVAIATAEAEERRKTKERHASMSKVIESKALDEVSTSREKERIIRVTKLDHESIAKKRALVLKKKKLDGKSLKEKRKAALIAAGYSERDIGEFLKDPENR